MTDLTALKPMENSSDIDGADVQGTTEDERTVETASNTYLKLCPYLKVSSKL